MVSGYLLDSKVAPQTGCFPWNVAHVDDVQDDAFLSGRDNGRGGEYGTYQVIRFSTGKPGVRPVLHDVNMEPVSIHAE